MKYILIAMFVNTSYFGGIKYTDGTRSMITMQEFDSKKSCIAALENIAEYFPDTKVDKGNTKLLCVQK